MKSNEKHCFHASKVYHRVGVKSKRKVGSGRARWGTSFPLDGNRIFAILTLEPLHTQGFNYILSSVDDFMAGQEA